MDRPVAATEATASALVAACEEAWAAIQQHHPDLPAVVIVLGSGVERGRLVKLGHWWGGRRSEEHTSELQSLMRISYAVFCLKKKKSTAHISSITAQKP